MNRGLLDTDRKPRRSRNGQTFSRKPHLDEKAKRNPPANIYIGKFAVQGGERVSPCGPPDCRYYFIILSEERNIHNSLSTGHSPVICKFPGSKQGEREKERSSGKGKKKTTLQEFLILMGGGPEKADDGVRKFFLSFPGEQTRNYFIFALLDPLLPFLIFQTKVKIYSSFYKTTYNHIKF